MALPLAILPSLTVLGLWKLGGSLNDSRSVAVVLFVIQPVLAAAILPWHRRLFQYHGVRFGWVLTGLYSMVVALWSGNAALSLMLVPITGPFLWLAMFAAIVVLGNASIVTALALFDSECGHRLVERSDGIHQSAAGRSS